MALTLRRWIGLLGVCSAAVFAAFQRDWTGPDNNDSRVQLARIERHLTEEYSVIQAHLSADEIGSLSLAAREGGGSAFLYEHRLEEEASRPVFDDCEIRRIDAEDGIFEGLLSPESCLSPLGGGIRVEVFEFELEQASWVQAEVTASDRGGRGWGIYLLGPDGEQLVNRFSNLRGNSSLTISEWVGAGPHKLIVGRAYFGGGPYELSLRVVSPDGLKEIQSGTRTGGGRISTVQPWGRIHTMESAAYWVNGKGSVYQSGKWLELPRVLRARDGEAIVAGALRDSVVVTPVRTVAEVLSPGRSVSGRLQPSEAPTIKDVAVRDSTYLAVAIQAEGRVGTQIYDSEWNLMGFGDQGLSAALAPGRYHVALGPVNAATDYVLWAGRCGSYFEVKVGDTFLPVDQVDEGCPEVRDVVTFEIAADRVLSADWGAEGEPVSTTIFNPDGTPWRMDRVTGVLAGRYNIVTAKRPTASLTIKDHGPTESFMSDRFRAEVESLRRVPSQAMVGAVALGPLARPKGFPDFFSVSRPGHFLGEEAENPYCVTLGSGSSLSYSFGDWERDLLGPCWTYARFGAPGPAVAKWLQDGGLGLADSRSESAPTEELATTGTTRPRDLFGRFPTGTYEALMEACRVRRMEVCEDAFLVGGNAREVDARAILETSLVPWNTRLHYSLGKSIVADLIAEFGEESFSAFWTSDREIHQAFATAFGMEIGAWMYAWTVERLGPMPPPRDLTLLEVLVSLVFLGIFVMVAGFLHARVDVGGQPRIPAKEIELTFF